ncbi:hypothetical protein [Candidatus Tisiphia endosymbiont of Ptychoptera albimana]|uniref:hypothetical protein n=1 Tax=Candidatus Tisiphia endosymbiont of Ptychoptera albimana TaxID=3066260 RepID=UPI001DB65196|nr:hypothetical protein [Rickettsia endosymbiont of Sericostoma sp. HW-2014]
MKRQNLPHLDKLKQNLSKIFTLIFVFYITIIISLYKCYNNKVKMEKAQVLQTQYNKIVEVSMHKLTSLSHRLSSSIEESNISINSNSSEIEICNEALVCTNCSFFRFGELLNRNIPEFIHYKIELNKTFIYSNLKVQNYQIETTYHINDSHQLNISLAINSVYWHKVVTDIKRPFWLLTAFITANMVLLYVLLKISFSNFNKSYALHYQDKHFAELEQLKLNHQQELKDCETFLMKKIWNNDFNKQKDLEINCLFAQEANQISLLDNNSDNQEDMLKDYRLRNFGDKVPCSITLYQENKIEEIDTTKLVDLFIDRFNQEDENISFKISSKAKILYFSSNAALYQIIYSVVSYLFFLLKNQPFITKHNIKLTIDSIKQKVVLHFEYDGYPIMTAQELLKTSNNFFKTHANPFLLNLSQVFNLLQTNGYNYQVSHNQSNVIEIYSNDLKNWNNQQEENVILLNSLIKRKK